MQGIAYLYPQQEAAHDGGQEGGERPGQHHEKEGPSAGEGMGGVGDAAHAGDEDEGRPGPEFSSDECMAELMHQQAEHAGHDKDERM